MSKAAATELSRPGLRPKGMTSPSRLLAVLVAPTLVLSACGANTEPTGSSIAPTTFEQAGALWAQNAPESYQMLLVSACGLRGGLGTYNVTVTPTNTTVKDGRRLRNGPGPYTVDQLFTYIASSGAEVIDVDYDEALGYPQKIRVDYLVGAIDDEACYTVKRFKPLDPIE